MTQKRHPGDSPGPGVPYLSVFHSKGVAPARGAGPLRWLFPRPATFSPQTATQLCPLLSSGLCSRSHLQRGTPFWVPACLLVNGTCSRYSGQVARLLPQAVTRGCLQC